MNIALIMGRKGSKGFPGKNLTRVLGRPLALYPMLAAKKCPMINKVFLSTDDKKLMRLARKNSLEIILRPDYLCTDRALGEDVFVHAYQAAKQLYPDEQIEFVVLLMCNAPTVTAQLICQGIEKLKNNPRYDSAVSVSRYNMWAPLRARKIGSDGLLHPFVPFETFGDPRKMNCDRDSQGDVYFADMGVSIVRPRCLDNLDKGLLPQRWMGKKILPLIQEAGFDVDYQWQMPLVEFWLKRWGGFKKA